MSNIEGLKKLREPFPPNQISKLPKPTKKQTEELKADYKKGARCSLCGGWHQPEVIHLDYVGHAALTDRLLDTDPAWYWEPLSMSESGLPVMDNLGGMWIKLTVCGVTRLGYGHAGDKEGGDAIKEVIGDALRNAAMRFGAALELWHKGNLHGDEKKSDPWADFTPQQKAKLREAGQRAITSYLEGKEWAAWEEYSTMLDKASNSEVRNQMKLCFWEVFANQSALKTYLTTCEDQLKEPK